MWRLQDPSHWKKSGTTTFQQIPGVCWGVRSEQRSWWSWQLSVSSVWDDFQWSRLEAHMLIHVGENCEGQDPDVTNMAQKSNIGPHMLISKNSTSLLTCQQNNWCYDFIKKLSVASPNSTIVNMLDQHRCPVCKRGFLCPLALKEHQGTCKFQLCWEELSLWWWRISRTNSMEWPNYTTFLKFLHCCPRVQ